MAQLGKLLAMLAAIAIILITLGGLVYGVVEDPAVVGPLAAAAVVVGVAIFQRRWEKSQELDRLHREQMSPIYKELVEMIKDIDKFSQKPEEEQEAFFKDLSTKLILHGPTPVISAWIAWQRAAAIDSTAVVDVRCLGGPAPRSPARLGTRQFRSFKRRHIAPLPQRRRRRRVASPLAGAPCSAADLDPQLDVE